MQFVHNFDTLMSLLRADGTCARVAVAAPHDAHTLEAVDAARRAGLAHFILIGDPAKITAAPGPDVEIVAEADSDRAAALAVKMAREGEADVIMKGLLNTDNLLRAVLNRETGIMPRGKVLTHLTAAEIPGRHKLLMLSDVAVIPNPTPEQHEAITTMLADHCHALGIENPRIALVHFNEKTTPKFPVTEGYARIRQLASEGRFGKVTVDGPMDVKTALDPGAGPAKGIFSPIEGDADALVFPDIEAGNTFYKTISWLSHSTNAGVVTGADVPVVVPSRGDTSRSKLCSLAVACLCARRKANN